MYRPCSVVVVQSSTIPRVCLQRFWRWSFRSSVFQCSSVFQSESPSRLTRRCSLKRSLGPLERLYLCSSKTIVFRLLYKYQTTWKIQYWASQLFSDRALVNLHLKISLLDLSWSVVKIHDTLVLINQLQEVLFIINHFFELDKSFCGVQKAFVEDLKI